ncbi:MAG: hypothetical protein ACPL4I_11330 [Bacteroidota bacterium]
MTRARQYALLTSSGSDIRIGGIYDRGDNRCGESLFIYDYGVWQLAYCDGVALPVLVSSLHKLLTRPLYIRTGAGYRYADIDQFFVPAFASQHLGYFIPVAYAHSANMDEFADIGADPPFADIGEYLSIQYAEEMLRRGLLAPITLDSFYIATDWRINLQSPLIAERPQEDLTAAGTVRIYLLPSWSERPRGVATYRLISRDYLLIAVKKEAHFSTLSWD